MRKLAITGLAVLVSTAAVADVSMYGFLKGNISRTDQMDSDSNPYFVTAKPTGGYSKFDKATHSAMSFRESRFGIKASNDSKVNGVLEFDLAGEEGNTSGVNRSTTGAFRIRQAYLTYAVSDNGTVNFGKKFTSFSGLNPHTMSVNQDGLFQGNVSRIGDLINYNHMMGNLGLTFELGSDDQVDTSWAATGNTTTSDKLVNQVSNPTMTLRVDYGMGDHKFGGSYSVASKEFKNVEDFGASNNIKNNVDIKAMNLFWNGTFGMTDVRAEYSQGTNALGNGWLTKATLPNLITSALTQDDFKDIEETAMWASAKHNFGSWALFGRYGISEITNADEAGSSTRSTATAGADGSIGTDKVVKNIATAIGVTFDLDKDFVVYGEYTMITTSRLATVTESSTNDDDGSVLNIGMMYNF